MTDAENNNEYMKKYWKEHPDKYKEHLKKKLEYQRKYNEKKKKDNGLGKSKLALETAKYMEDKK